MLINYASTFEPSKIADGLHLASNLTLVFAWCLLINCFFIIQTIADTEYNWSSDSISSAVIVPTDAGNQILKVIWKSLPIILFNRSNRDLSEEIFHNAYADPQPKTKPGSDEFVFIKYFVCLRLWIDAEVAELSPWAIVLLFVCYIMSLNLVYL